MSWALEAIEKAALERARQQIALSSLTLMGYSAEQIAAFDHFWRSRFDAEPTAMTGQQIADALRLMVPK